MNCSMRATLAVLLLCIAVADAASPKKSPVKGGLVEYWKSTDTKQKATDIVTTLAIYEGLTLGWMLSSWLLAWLIQPTRMGLVKPLTMCFGEPNLPDHGPRSTAGPIRLVDRLLTSFKYYESRAEHALEFVSNATPLNLRHLGFSYAESVIFRKCTVPVTAPARLLVSLKILDGLKEGK